MACSLWTRLVSSSMDLQTMQYKRNVFKRQVDKTTAKLIGRCGKRVHISEWLRTVEMKYLQRLQGFLKTTAPLKTPVFELFLRIQWQVDLWMTPAATSPSALATISPWSSSLVQSSSTSRIKPPVLIKSTIGFDRRAYVSRHNNSSILAQDDCHRCVSFYYRFCPWIINIISCALTENDRVNLWSSFHINFFPLNCSTCA